MFCKKCGKEIQMNDKFCMTCGAATVPQAEIREHPVSAKSLSSFFVAGDLSSDPKEKEKASITLDAGKKKDSSTKDFFQRADDLSGGGSAIRNEVKKKSPSEHCSTKVDDRIATGAKFEQFQRSPRIMHELPSGTIDICSPPALGSKPEINWLATFLPTAITIGIAIVMTVVMGNPMMLLYTLPMTIGGVVVSVTNYRRQTKKYEEKTELRKKKYEDYLVGIVQDIEQKRMEQATAMLLADPSTEECIGIVLDRQPRLWHRTPDDPDFVSVRIGNGPVDFSVRIDVPKESLTLEEDDLKAKPSEIKKRYAQIESAPITCSIYKEQICGIVGRKQETKTLVKNMIVQLSTHHSYSELNLICVYNHSDEAELQWLKDIPHFHTADRKKCFIATSKDEAKELFQHFSDLLKQRRVDSDFNTSYGVAPIYLPYFLFIILEPAYLDKTDPINDHLFMSRNLGVGCVMTVQNVSQLPKECRELIVLKGNEGHLFNSDSATQKRAFVLDHLSKSAFETFGQSIKSLCCDEGIKRETLPKSYSFFEMFNIFGIEDVDIGERWNESDVVNTLAAPLGISENGKILYLDLHEKAHGPHGLVAGTTGSGKSELLQSYILSMAMTYHPYDVGFVIIDFKGGGMASQVAGLPHLLGTITNIDGHELNRSLMSINAELVRRQEIIKKYNDIHDDKIKDIYDYFSCYKSGRTAIPLPHLIIIVDEFAELKEEQPEFMKELISAARIGRSLGVHLILATQKPAGQVDEQIRGNIRFQVCLKVASASDSKEVIQSELASQIVDPGRAYLRVGNNEIFRLFQSGYSGKKLLSATGLQTTQLQESIHFLTSLWANSGIEKLPNICLPSLSTCIKYPSADSKKSRKLIPVGIYDDPSKQYQGGFYLDPFDKNTLIIGTARTGKTNFLQVLIRSIADSYTPKEVNIYIIDFASMILKSMESLNHVGGVVTPSEDEKFKNLMKMLSADIERRRKNFFDIGVSSYDSYIEAGESEFPRIVLMIDNFTVLRELYLTDIDPLLTICQHGLTYGISVVVANSQTTGINQHYLSCFSTRIALYCNNSTEYHVLFEKCGQKLKDIPGRSIIEKDDAFYQCQLFHAFVGEKEIEKTHEIRKYISVKNEQYPMMQAVAIPVIPDLLRVEDILSFDRDSPGCATRIVAGLDYESVSPIYLDLKTLGMLALSGRSRFGRSNFLRYLVCTAGSYPGKVEFYIVDGIDRKLKEFKDHQCVTEYAFLPDRARETVERIEAVLASRYQSVASGELGILDTAPVLVLMLNSLDAIEAISSNSMVMAKYNNIIGKYKTMNVCVILGAVENASIPYSAPEILKKWKEDRKLLFFDDIDNLKLFDLPYSATKKYKKSLEVGDCYFIKGNECVKIKTPKY